MWTLSCTWTWLELEVVLVFRIGSSSRSIAGRVRHVVGKLRIPHLGNEKNLVLPHENPDHSVDVWMYEEAGGTGQATGTFGSYRQLEGRGRQIH